MHIIKTWKEEKLKFGVIVCKSNSVVYQMFYVGLIATKIEHLCWKTKQKTKKNKQLLIKNGISSKTVLQKTKKYFPRITKVDFHHHYNYLRRNVQVSLSS